MLDMNNWVAPNDFNHNGKQSLKDLEQNNGHNNKSPTTMEGKLSLNHFTLGSDPPKENLSNMRSKKLEKIVSNISSEPVDILSVMSCFFGIGLSIASTALITCWPQQ